MAKGHENVISRDNGRQDAINGYTKPLKSHCFPGGGGGGRYFLVKYAVGMCRWMGSHFRNWTDYNWVTFLAELLEWGRTFSGFLG